MIDGLPCNEKTQEQTQSSVSSWNVSFGPLNIFSQYEINQIKLLRPAIDCNLI